MSTEVELIARDIGLVLHDTFFIHLYSQHVMFQMPRCIDHRYSAKVHDTNLVLMEFRHPEGTIISLLVRLFWEQ